MLKKIWLIFIFFMLLFAQTTVCYAAKITNVNFDNADNIMFIGANAHDFSCSDLHIKPVMLKEPDRFYFDIPNAILSNGNKSWFFKNTAIQQVKIAQFSTNPAIVRVVVYYNRNFNPDKVRFYCSQNSGLIVEFNQDYNPKNNTVSIYRSQSALSSDLYEKVVYATEDKVQKISNNLEQAPSNTTNIDALRQIQKAINLHTEEDTQPFNLILDKEFVLKSNYFIRKVDIKRGNALISGVGNVELLTPLIVSNPSRLVIDMPNTIISQGVKNREFSLTETDTIRIGQFEPSKARIVVTTPTPEKYLAIMALDSQSLFIGHEQRLGGLKFANNNSQLISLKSASSNDYSEEFRINFDNGIIPAIQKTDSNFELSILNLHNFDVEGLRKAAKNTKLQTLKVEKSDIGGLKFIFPVKKTTQINVYEHVNNKQLEVKFVYEKPVVQKIEKITKKIASSKVIILDAGHGGQDVGATRQGVFEKNINLPISIKVAEILRAKGYLVYLTRNDDTFLTLQERVDFTKARGGGVFVSIHANSCAKEEVSGIETHYYKNTDFELAQNIHNSMMRYVSAEDRGLFKSKFYVISHNEIPAVLLEVGFMTNPHELADIQTTKRQNDTAKAIAEGIINYLSGK